MPEPADDKIPVFTEAEVYAIGGYLAQWWDLRLPDADVVTATERAIISALSVRPTT